MSEPDEEIPTVHSRPLLQSSTADQLYSLMDLDLDLDLSWPFDQNIFIPNPTSPSCFLSIASPMRNPAGFGGSSLDQPGSPIWVLSDGEEDNEKLSSNGRARLILGNSDRSSKNRARDRSKGKLVTTSGVPVEKQDGSSVIKERMLQALQHFKESMDQNILAQIWAPVKNGDQYVLTTSGQPFVLDHQSNGLLQYRTVSLMYKFSVEGETEGELGLPGRVFRQKLPEWSPDVQYYSSKEYPRLSHAQHYNVRGTLALPIFDSSKETCIGVVELIMMSQKINYAPEVDLVCKALEAVNLKSSDLLDKPNFQIANDGRQNALVEILEILTVVCEKHKLPLAQTWVPCEHREVLADGGGLRKSCTSFDGNCMGQVCMSTTDVAVYVLDAHMWGFRDACSEHHLQKGQGVAGRAFLSKGSCFSRDITQFTKTQYPLVHYARMFGLSSCFATCLRSSYTGNDDYILEFFLPPSIVELSEQLTFLDSVLATMKQHYRTLKVASGDELGAEKPVEITDTHLDNKDHDSVFTCIQITPRVGSPPDPVPVKQEILGDKVLSRSKSDSSVLVNKDVKKSTEKRRGKTEKSISLEVLQQYFAGSLKDAAKSLGVCPTTMKRICRNHGISRWPSRKINKVNRSLSKINRVIASVQGAEGAFTLTPMTTQNPNSTSSIPTPVCLNGPKQHSPNPPEPVECQKVNGMEQGGGNTSSGGLNAASGSGEESTEGPTSQGSCQGSPINETAAMKGMFISSNPVQVEPLMNFQIPFTVEEPTLSGLLVEDAGSSKDLRNLEDYPEDHNSFFAPQEMIQLAPQQTPHLGATLEMKTLTFKVNYGDDIIRFRLPFGSGLLELMQEAAKRFKLEVGEFEVKYLDEEQEWVSLHCDTDLQECMDISRSLGKKMIRLSVYDIMTNLGSSSESSRWC
ncbi:hypothetical protein ACHQM5_000128 [Ranunculus cassubicifolius]